MTELERIDKRLNSLLALQQTPDGYAYCAGCFWQFSLEEIDAHLRECLQ